MTDDPNRGAIAAMPPTSRPISPATRAWWAYERDTEYEIVGTTITVPVRDGVTIACELRRPPPR